MKPSATSTLFPWRLQNTTRETHDENVSNFNPVSMGSAKCDKTETHDENISNFSSVSMASVKCNKTETHDENVSNFSSVSMASAKYSYNNRNAR